MISTRLVRLIEDHSSELAQGLTRKLWSHPALTTFVQRVPPEEIQQRVLEIYKNLTDWLMNKTEVDIERRYTAIGARRAQQNVPLSQVLLAILAVKEHLWDYLKSEGLVDRHVELFQEMELLQMVERFFDRAAYFVARGYESVRAARAA